MTCIDSTNLFTGRLNCDPGVRNLVESACEGHESGRAESWDSLRADTREAIRLLPVYFLKNQIAYSNVLFYNSSFYFLAIVFSPKENRHVGRTLEFSSHFPSCMY